ncbi:glycerophosphodiester phosphodiesterase [Candidatus Lokiarchaeum ossiferum]|uniref:glycerophosphodiester phosphodiesterase n=1 Tax=Candidatus Lokiarchaeum ossiferum TaxID=2951803 RepID=UPI00352BEE13
MWQISRIPFVKNYRPLVMAHRGDSANVPENTLASFEDAYKLNVDCIESDTHLTKDGQFVLFHDDKLDRTTDGTGLIADYTVEELKKLDTGFHFSGTPDNPHPFRGKGYHIHTIDEILPTFPDVRFNLDIKSKNPKAPELLAKKLADLEVEERVMVGSFHQGQIRLFRKNSKIPTGAGSREVLSFWRKSKSWIRKHPEIIQNNNPVNPDDIDRNQKEVFGKLLPYYALQIPEGYLFLKIVKPEFIIFAHHMGIAVHIWTINDAKDMRRLLQWGVDGIFTDHPKILLEVVGSINK